MFTLRRRAGRGLELPQSLDTMHLRDTMHRTGTTEAVLHVLKYSHHHSLRIDTKTANLLDRLRKQEKIVIHCNDEDGLGGVITYGIICFDDQTIDDASGSEPTRKLYAERGENYPFTSVIELNHRRAWGLLGTRRHT